MSKSSFEFCQGVEQGRQEIINKVRNLKADCEQALNRAKPFTRTDACTNMQGRIQALELLLELTGKDSND